MCTFITLPGLGGAPLVARDSLRQARVGLRQALLLYHPKPDQVIYIVPITEIHLYSRTVAFPRLVPAGDHRTILAAVRACRSEHFGL
jgi:hypothetical protein